MAEKIETPPPENPGPEYLYQEGLKAGKFLIQKCDGCGTHIFYARLLCPSCGSDKISQLEASGGGTVIRPAWCASARNAAAITTSP